MRYLKKIKRFHGTGARLGRIDNHDPLRAPSWTHVDIKKAMPTMALSRHSVQCTILGEKNGRNSAGDQKAYEKYATPTEKIIRNTLLLIRLFSLF